jgi:hypothetical protein
MKPLVTACLVALAATVAPTQDPPRELSELAARAGLPAPVGAWCQGDIEPDGGARFAVAAGAHYLILRRDGTTIDLAAYEDKPDLACYTPAEAAKLSTSISESETIEGRIEPRWSTTVVCGFTDNTTAACWQYSPAERKMVRVGGWVT